jgi:hypothetical protein
LSTFGAGRPRDLQQPPFDAAAAVAQLGARRSDVSAFPAAAHPMSSRRAGLIEIAGLAWFREQLKPRV